MEASRTSWRRRLLDYGASALLLLLPFVVFSSSLKQTDDRTKFDKAVVRLSAPLQSGVTWVIDSVVGAWDRYIALVDVEEENEELRVDNAALRRALVLLRTQVTEGRELQALLSMKNTRTPNAVGARVVSMALDRRFRVVRIQLESGVPLDVGMAVVTPDGLVGRIHSAYGDYADVLLTTDPRSSVDVVIPRTKARGVVTGRSSGDAYHLELEYLQRKESVAVGDTVTTSGLGGAVPAHLPVGVVSEVVDNQAGLYYHVVVRPVVDLARVGHVLVLLGQPAAARSTDPLALVTQGQK